MTTPPGGPYGQGPYGNDPHGQNPYWGGQPQGGGPYPYPYPPQQYYPGGQQFPPGYYPPGPPPPRGSGSKLPWLIVAGLVALSIVALIVTLIVLRGGDHHKPSNARPTATSGAPASPPKGSAQNASDCTPNVSGGQQPTGDTVSAGKLSFPASTAPGWTPFSDDQDPNLIDAVGVAREVPGVNNWVMEAEVGVTNFVPSMDVTAQASKFLQCLVAGPAYGKASPTLGPAKTSSITVDGVKAARVDADVTIGDPTLNTKGDSVTVIAVDTKPVTVFFAATPIGDADSAATIANVIGALKVTKS